ncbi:MAG: hypothetical protein U0324_19140 [Polyangiales bacterium]
MIEAGEPLGTRYVVVRPVADPRAGVLFEIVDRAGQQLAGQLLHDAAVAPAVAQEVRAALVGMPALAAILKPRDVALSPHALPVAILERPGGVAPLKERVGAVVEALGKREATQWLLRQCGAVASDLAQVHQAGIVHGAIGATSLVVAAEGDVGMPQLAGFGVNAFARGNDPQKAPTRRADLVELLGAMQDVFQSAGLSPEGAAAAKWSILCASARHGEHPALASGTALASALNEMASLKVDDSAPPPRPSMRAQTLVGPRSSAPPPSPGSGAPPRGSQPPERRASTIPPQGRSSHASRTGMKTAPRAEEPPPPPSTKWKVSLALVVPAVLVIAAGVGGMVWYALHLNDDVTEGRLTAQRRPPAAVPTAACAGESHAQAQGVADFRGTEFEAVCMTSPDRLGLVARKGTEVLLTTRPVERGQRFGEAQTVARGVVELGGSLVREGVLWASWRNGVGDPFGIGRVEGERVAAVSVPIAGWDSIPLRGAMLLDVSPRAAWLVTNVAPQAEGAHAILLQVTFGPSAPDVVAWRLGDGVAESVIPGAAPAVLLRQRVQDGAAARLEFVDVGLNLAAVAQARRPAEATAVGGAALPEAAVTRSPAVPLDGAVAGVVRHGVDVGGAHAWLVGRGGVRPADSCETPERCHTAGPVAVLAFGGASAPAVTPVIPSGWATEIVAAGEGVRVYTTAANVAGVELPFHAAATLATPRTAPGAERVNVATFRSPRVRVVSCGREAWAVFDAVQPSPALSALPAACLQTQ